VNLQSRAKTAQYGLGRGKCKSGAFVECLRCGTRLLSFDAFVGRASTRGTVQLREFKALKNHEYNVRILCWQNSISIEAVELFSVPNSDFVSALAISASVIRFGSSGVIASSGTSGSGEARPFSLSLRLRFRNGGNFEQCISGDGGMDSLVFSGEPMIYSWFLPPTMARRDPVRISHWS
jgi:hypothetical protein